MKYLFALILTLASFGTALADSRDSVVTTVPFDFAVGNKTFTAGTYTISRISADAQAGLRIQSADGQTSAFFHPTTSEPAQPDDEPKLQFRHEDDKYFLAAVFSGLEIYTVAPIRHHQTTTDPEDVMVTALRP